jgi:hypothetical protein
MLVNAAMKMDFSSAVGYSDIFYSQPLVTRSKFIAIIQIRIIKVQNFRTITSQKYVNTSSFGSIANSSSRFVSLKNKKTPQKATNDPTGMSN